MFTVIVELSVRPERLAEFLEGIRVNSLASLRDEPGCLRFDVHRSTEDPHRFLLYEVYRDETAFRDEHRSAPHYTAWREVASRCLVDGSHVNHFATPLFPQDIPERPSTDPEESTR